MATERMRRVWWWTIAIGLVGSACAARLKATPQPVAVPDPAVAPAIATPVTTARPRPTLPVALDPAALDAYVGAEIERRGIVGAQLVVLHHGEIVLDGAYGLASTHTRAPVTRETAFAIGSITKQFTCAAALLLAERGKLRMNHRVARYYPTLTRAHDITLDDLGAHLSGYPDYYPLDFLDRRMQAPIDPDALLARYAGAPLDFEPRTRWSYSNTGFILLGRVIEKVAKASFAEVLQASVFTPLGMTHSAIAAAGSEGMAAGHASFALGPAEPVAPESPGWLHAAGGMVATAGDLARWDLALADGELLGKASLRALTSARTLGDGRRTDYGCGLGLRRAAGEEVWSHSGAVSGFLAFNATVPRTRSAVILLTNTEGGNPGELHQQVLGLVLAADAAVPAVAGPSADVVARELFDQLRRGALDRARLGEEFSAFMTAARVEAAAGRLRAIEPSGFVVTERRERGGMEVATIRIEHAAGSIRALLYRTPDGKVQEFLLMD